jgi:hypothetical protein
MSIIFQFLEIVKEKCNYELEIEKLELDNRKLTNQIEFVER